MLLWCCGFLANFSPLISLMIAPYLLLHPVGSRLSDTLVLPPSLGPGSGSITAYAYSAVWKDVKSFVRAAPLEKLLRSPCVDAGTGRSTSLLQHLLQHVQDMHLQPVLQHSLARLEVPRVILISYFSASGKALLSGPKILLGGRTDSRTDVRPAT